MDIDMGTLKIMLIQLVLTAKSRRNSATKRELYQYCIMTVFPDKVHLRDLIFLKILWDSTSIL